MYGGHEYNFNPRSPRGERLNKSCRNSRKIDISIHALREESDNNSLMHCHKPKPFQSTLSARRATPTLLPKSKPAVDFNPRSPRGERLLIGHAFNFWKWYFNPRSPRGERQFKVWNYNNSKVNFNPRSPRGERPWFNFSTLSAIFISIHALREESDFAFQSPLANRRQFQSTLSARRATQRFYQNQNQQ